jgi:hypothetical protein
MTTLKKNETKVAIIKFMNQMRKISFQYFGQSKVKEFQDRFKEDYSFEEVRSNLIRQVVRLALPIDTVDKYNKNLSSCEIATKSDFFWILSLDIPLDKKNLQSFYDSYILGKDLTDDERALLKKL